MIQSSKFSDTWEITCDNCSHEFIEIEASSFTDMITELKQLGWIIRKDEEEDEWNHYCPECGLSR